MNEPIFDKNFEKKEKVITKSNHIFNNKSNHVFNNKSNHKSCQLRMGSFFSQTKLPPHAELEEILNSDLMGPMMFEDGIYARVPTKDTSIVINMFEIEKRRHIQRVRNYDKTLNEVLISYNKDDLESAKQKLIEKNIEPIIFTVPLPLWCPFTEKQRHECLAFWPMNNIVAAPQLPVDPIFDHSVFIEKVISEKSVIIKSPNSNEIISSASSDCVDCNGNISHGIIDALAAASKYSASLLRHDSYLCTGFDVYCYYEPCVMCAMAMVHSRVGRLFFVSSNPDFGGITSQIQIHSCPKLNHRYRAFIVKM
ncbi:Cytidine and deoxycytidylate deaminase zinc-binding region family protein [Tritrichomonas foetus]|uniref:Cytidine and deoxycytidylate deaminase zinc-binding region family protein n=1 Tax=Tritrichomonas foetus TaxID=1144522 RepID=A0A1J4JYF9_9EUKA|nr:Cytidine and deoxycytidylate deaminase zinc-binding region family protein [Tritrichomonas foetus]|eukprot:OHT03730.1 Cytidine and deoxycytidylate deaminase zinc-binding region family protein [Tritrichomonas foetus]